MIELVKKIIGEVKEDPELVSTLSDSHDIIHDVGLDSLQIINFILKIEEVFDLELDFENFDVSHFESIDIFCQFISEQRAKGKPEWQEIDLPKQCCLNINCRKIGAK